MLIVGGGAIGTLFAIQASRHVPTTLLVRHLPDDASRGQPIVLSMISRISNNDASPSSLKTQAVRVITAAELDRSYPITLLACKQFDLRECSASLKKAQVKTKLCITLSNGLGCVEQVQSGGFDCEEISPAVTYVGARLVSDFTVERTGVGETILREPRDAHLQKILRDAIPDLKFVTQQELDAVIWKKLLANCCINPLTAILQCRNGDIPSVVSDDFLSLLCEEFLRVSPVCIPGIASTNDAVQFVKSVCEKTSQNNSSMYMDLVKQKRKTEIESMTGALVEKYKVGNAHRTLYEMIKALEKRNSLEE